MKDWLVHTNGNTLSLCRHCRVAGQCLSALVVRGSRATERGERCDGHLTHMGRGKGRSVPGLQLRPLPFSGCCGVLLLRREAKPCSGAECKKGGVPGGLERLCTRPVPAEGTLELFRMGPCHPACPVCPSPPGPKLCLCLSCSGACPCVLQGPICPGSP